MKINLGVHLGFAITRYPEPDQWVKIVKKELDIKYVQFASDLLDSSFNKTNPIFNNIVDILIR